MLPYPLEEITEDVLIKVCKERWPETASLDFKSKPEARAESVQKDVCAMANSFGGDIFIGIDEEHGEAQRIRPYQDNPDELERTLRQFMDAIEPRLPRVEFRAIALAEGGYVIAVRVHASFDGPHTFRPAKGDNVNWRFVMRNGSRNADMSYPQIRESFLRKGALAEKTRAHFTNRANFVSGPEFARRFGPGPILSVHVAPLSGIAGDLNLPLKTICLNSSSELAPPEIWRGGVHPKLGIEGLRVRGEPVPGKRDCQTTLFRNGALEFLYSVGGLGQGDIAEIQGNFVATAIRESLKTAIAFGCRHGISGPAIVRVALLRVDGHHTFVAGGTHGPARVRNVEDRHLVLPDQEIVSLASATNVDEIAWPLIDLLWQCFNLTVCIHYDESGTWLDDRRWPLVWTPSH